MQNWDFLMTAFFIVSGIGQALAGFVVDRIGARAVLFFGMACLTFSALMLSMAQTYPMLLIGSMLAGLGNSVFHPSDFTLLNKKVSAPRLGHAFSVHGIFGQSRLGCRTGIPDINRTLIRLAHRAVCRCIRSCRGTAFAGVASRLAAHR
jgi:predicted MFS family arabinose efflux permease